VKWRRLCLGRVPLSSKPLRLHALGLQPGHFGIHLPAAPQVHIARHAVLAPGDHWRPSAESRHPWPVPGSPP
jgi:hypothetical protein